MWLRDEVGACTCPVVVHIDIVSGKVWYDLLLQTVTW